jgi:hypothetical protein
VRKALFVCGSVNQTKQMHRIAARLPEFEAYFTPYYCDGFLERCRRLGLLEFTILGWSWRKDCLRYLRRNGLALDYEGRRLGNDYNLVVTSSDVIVPQNIRRKRLVAVQEGITDPEGFWFHVRRFLPFLPRWSAGTAWTGTSNLCDRFCVASEGYRDLFVRRGADAKKVVVTGIPNFDNCAAYNNNTFPHRDYVLVCTSDARETWKFDNRRRFLRRVQTLANGRSVIFKLHPNENVERASAEIRRIFPGSPIFSSGLAEEMVANCNVLVCQYSTLAFVGLALGKEVHSYFPLDELKRLLPEQNARGAENIAAVCRRLLAEASAEASLTRANELPHGDAVGIEVGGTS